MSSDEVGSDEVAVISVTYNAETEQIQENQQVSGEKMYNNTEERLSLLEDREQVVVKKSKYKCPSHRYCVVSLVVLALVLVAIVTALAVSLPLGLIPRGQESRAETLKFDDIFNPSFQTRAFSGIWTKDNKILYHNNDGVFLYDPVTNTPVELADWSSFDGLKVSQVKLSATRSYLLLIGNVTKIYRHSYTADYQIYNIQTNSIFPLGTDILYSEWSPIANKLVYVKDNDIYTYDVPTGDHTRHTYNGAPNVIYNGVPDWVYEEEVLSTNFALWWSGDGSRILYLSFNDSQVERFKFPHYGPSDDQYTEIESIAYPKAGAVNPTVRVYVVDIYTGDTVELNRPESLDGDHYVTSGGWAGQTTPVVSWMNREQNLAIHCLYDNISSDCRQVYMQQSQAWIEMVIAPIYDGYNNALLFIDTVSVGDDGYLHLVQVDINNEARTPLTTGEWEVTDVLGVNENTILYISTRTNPWQRHVYNSINDECLTCNWLSARDCQYWSGSCSQDLSYCLLHCNGPSLPFTVLASFTNNQLVLIEYMELNEPLQKATENISLPTAEVIEIPSSSSDEPSLYARVLYPPGMVRDCSVKYPVLFYVYGGPYSQMIGDVAVTNRLSIAYFSSHLNMVVVSVDGRGTGFRGNKFKFSVYHQLGRLETEDQLKAARYLKELCYLNPDEFSIYGASYGGYMAGLVGEDDELLFSKSISQSPVSDWLYYDSIYTERYMGTPSTNPTGYTETSLLPQVSNLNLISYLLIHGTGDDNVHFQNTAQLVHELTESEVQYRLMFYTDQDHSLSGGNTRQHLYKLIVDFLNFN